MSARPCDACGLVYEARSSASQCCSAKCRKRKSRNPRQDPPIGPATLPHPVVAEPHEAAPPGSVAEATRAELDAAGRADSPLGRVTLLLADRLDHSNREPGTSLAALVRQHEASLASAVRGAKKAADPVDELRARRDRKRAG